MSVSEAKPTNQPAAIAAARRNGRPLRIGGGPPNYADNAAKALSENWKGVSHRRCAASGTISDSADRSFDAADPRSR